MSKLTVWPYVFTLQSCSLVEAYRRGFDGTQVAAVANQNPGVPVALRWLTTPELGFPRRPFNVYRRVLTDQLPVSEFRSLLAAPVVVDGVVDFAFPPGSGGLIYFVWFDLTLLANQSLSILGYDLFGKILPGLNFEASASKNHGFFACPGMAGLRITGTGTVRAIRGVNQEDYANLPGWQLIQVVGLPANQGELGSAYDSNVPQGYVAALTNGYQAAAERLLVAHKVRGVPPATGIPSFPLPPWPASNILPYLNGLRSGTNLFPMIKHCLEQSVDSNPAKMQSVYQETVSVQGIRQANLPGNPPQTDNPSKAVIPVVGISMLGISTDSDAATALGYGTIDIPALDNQGGSTNTKGQTVSVPTTNFNSDNAVMTPDSEYVYMVCAPYVLPGGLTLQLAALSQPAAAVQGVAGFNSEVLATHAVLRRDDTAQVAVELSWQPPTTPQACALLVSRSPFGANVLNTVRALPVGGYDPYLGLAPENPPPGTSAEDLLPNFKDAAGQLPVSGTATTRYLAAGIDVFGQWSPWTETDLTLTAAPVTQPGLRKVTWMAGALPASGKLVPYSLIIEVAWDWTDRSPGVIRITGKFVPPKTALGPPFPSGLALSNDGAAGAPLLLTWNYGGNNPTTVNPGTVLPTLDANHTGTVDLINDVSQIANNQVMQYRVTITGFILDYTLADEIDLALYAAASERIQPGKWSDLTDRNTQPSAPPAYIGRTARAYNPLPPVVVFNPPAINWTALPDAYQKARGVLEWTGDPSAAGYMVWESTESALLQLLSPAAPNPDPSELLVTRGATLKALVANNYETALSQFSRLNTDPVTGSRMEVELPGSAAVLYAYMVSAVSSQGVEAKRPSNIAFFGVPQRQVPGQPRLRIRQLPPPTPAQPAVNGLQVIALPVESGVVPAGYRVYRVRSSALASDAGLMGPPKISNTDSGWQPYTETPLFGGTVSNGQSIIDLAATASWYPYHYRVDAIGPEDKPNGKYSGWSLPSQVQSEYCLPPNPPLIQSPALQRGSGAGLLTFTTDLPISASPLGPSLVELLQAGPDTSSPGRTLNTVVLTSAPEAIQKFTLELPMPPWSPSPQPFPLPPILMKSGGGVIVPPPPNRNPPVYRGPVFARSDPDSQGQWMFFVLVPYTVTDVNTYTVRLTDPLGRQSSTTF